MLPVNRFRCYAFRDGPFWYVDCLDLMLLVKRESLPAAMQELELLILDHVQAARDGSGAPAPRPVKLADRLAFLRRAFGHALRVLFTGRTDGLVTYEVHIPAADPELKIVYA